MKNILCLSSGRMPQYRLDILRVIALPTGATIQFRYSEHLVHSDLLKPLAQNECTGRQLIVGHVDGNAERILSDGNCPITLCRYGTLTRSERSGSYFVLHIELGSMVLSHDWQAAQADIESVRPHLRDGVTATADEAPLTGLWCFETALTTVPERTLDSVGMWEAVVTQLWQSPDFRQQPVFYSVKGLHVGPIGSTTRETMSGGEFTLRTDKEYELRVLHWHPEADSRPPLTQGSKMLVTVESPQLRSITSPQLPLDSPYDVKTYKVRTGQSTKEEFSSFVVRIVDKDGKPVENQPELFLPARIQPSYVKVGFVVLALAALLWLQQLVPLLIKGTQDWATALSTLGLAILAAFVVVFGLKKPLA